MDPYSPLVRGRTPQHTRRTLPKVGPITLMLVGTLFLAATTPRLAHAGDLMFNGCSSDQQQKLKDAWLAAKTMVLGASTYVREKSVEAPAPFETWFGPLENADTRTIVETNLLSTYSTATDPFLADCTALDHDCLENSNPSPQKITLAYVHYLSPDIPRKVYLCAEFFDKPPAGELGDTMPSIVAHEWTHFLDGANTQDNETARNRERCLALAKSDPHAAATNAYSYEFFLASQPLLSVSACSSGIGGAPPPTGMTSTFVALLLASLIRRRMNRRKATAGTTLVAVSACLSGCVHGPGPNIASATPGKLNSINCILSGPTEVRLGERIPIKIRLRNVSGSDTVHFETNESPFEHVESSRRLKVNREGVPISWLPNKILRREERKEWEFRWAPYLTLLPHQEIVTTIAIDRLDETPSGSFPIEEPGIISVTLPVWAGVWVGTPRWRDLPPTVELDCNPVIVRVNPVPDVTDAR